MHQVLIFTIIIIASLLLIVYSLYNKIKQKLIKRADTKYIQLCPDYWEIVKQERDDDGNVIALECKNVHNLGGVANNPSNNTFRFEGDLVDEGHVGNIARCNFSKEYDVSWDKYNGFC